MDKKLTEEEINDIINKIIDRLPKKAPTARVNNNINIKLAKPRSSGAKKENVDLAEKKLQELEQKDLEFKRSNIPFSNPNIFGFNVATLTNQRLSNREAQIEIEAQREMQKKRQEEEATIAEQEQGFYRSTSAPQTGRSGLGLYQTPPLSINPDFPQRLAAEGFTDEEQAGIERQLKTSRKDIKKGGRKKKETEPEILNRLAREQQEAKAEQNPKGERGGLRG
jgi:hypothetical protein